MTTDESRDRAADPPTEPPRGEREAGDGGFGGAGRILTWIGWGAAGLLVLYLGAAVALRTLVPPETLARWAETRAEAALNRDVEIGGARLSVFPHLGMVLEQVTVGNLADFDGPPLARADRSELRVALLPLLRADVVVDEAVARGLDVRLQVDEDGDTNFGDLLPASEEPEPGSGPGPLPVSLAVRDVGFQRSRLEYRDRRTGRLLLLDSLEARGSLTRAEPPGGWDGSLEAEGGRFTATLPSLREEPFRPGAVAARIGLRAGPRFGWIEVDEGTLDAGGVPLSLTGRVDSLRSPVRRLSLELGADSLDLPSLAGSAPAGALPDRVRSLAGTASLRVGVTGALGDGRVPDVGGVLRLRGAGASLAGRGRVAEGLSGTLRLRADTLALERLEGSVLDGPFRLSGTLSLDSAGAFSGRLESAVDLAALSPGAGARGGASGRVEADLDLSGRSARPAETSARGTVLLREVALPADSPRAPVRVPRGTLRFEGRSVTWSDLPLSIGGDRLATEGRVDRWAGFLADDGGLPAVRARASAGRLDLEHLLPWPDGSPTYGQLLFARLGRDTLQGRSAGQWAEALRFARPASLPAGGTLELTVDSLLFEPYAFRSLEARVEFGPEWIRVPAARFDLFGGRVEQSVSVALGEQEARPFTFSLTARGLRAGDFLDTTSPLGRLLTGAMNLDLEATGRLDRALLPVRDSVLGRGRLAVEGGGLAENPVTGAVADLLSYPAFRSPSVQRVAVPFRVEGGSVRFDTARLATAAGALEWSGAAGLGGSLDLGARLLVPRSRLPEMSLEGAGIGGQRLSRLRGGEGPLELGLAVSGSVSSPRVSLDTDALRDRAEEAARGVAEEEIQRRIRQGRSLMDETARRLLGRLSGAPDTAPAEPPPADTARPDTAAADTTGPR